MELRYGTKKDILIVKPYLIKMWLMHDDEEHIFKRGLIEGTDLIEYFKEVFDGSNKSYLLIVEEGNELAGFCKVNITSIERFFYETEVLYIDDVYVIDKYRRKGVAETLLREAEKIAKEQNIKWLKARVYTFNKKAQGLFEKKGYRSLYSEWFKTDL